MVVRDSIRSFIKSAARRKARPLIRSDAASGLTAAFMTESGKYRAGVVESMARSAGIPVPWRVRNPTASLALETGVGGVAGALLGSGIGYLLEGHGNTDYVPSDLANTASLGLLGSSGREVGGVLGGLFGGIAGAIHSKTNREEGIRGVHDAYVNTPISVLTPTYRAKNLVWTLGGGGHDRGRYDGVKRINDDIAGRRAQTKIDNISALSDAMSLTGVPAGMVPNAIAAYTQDDNALPGRVRVIESGTW